MMSGDDAIPPPVLSLALIGLFPCTFVFQSIVPVFASNAVK